MPSAVRLIHIRKGYKRTLRVRDLDQLGIPHQGQPLSWGPENGFTIVMSDEMSDSLIAALPKEFIALLAPGQTRLSPKVEIADDSGQGNLLGLLNDSLSDPDDDDESSTDDIDPDE